MITKRYIFATLCASMLAAACVAELVPELLTATFYRTNVVATVTSATHYKGTTLRLTNCAARSVTGAAQNLTGCGILVRIGDATTNLLTYGAVQNATGGTFTAGARIPNGGGQTMRVQLKLTNGATIYVYPSYLINVEAPL